MSFGFPYVAENRITLIYQGLTVSFSGEEFRAEDGEDNLSRFGYSRFRSDRGTRSPERTLYGGSAIEGPSFEDLQWEINLQLISPLKIELINAIYEKQQKLGTPIRLQDEFKAMREATARQRGRVRDATPDNPHAQAGIEYYLGLFDVYLEFDEEEDQTLMGRRCDELESENLWLLSFGLSELHLVGTSEDIA